MSDEELVREDDYFRIGDDVIVNSFNGDMNSRLQSWVVGSQAKIAGIRKGRNSFYLIEFDKEHEGLWGKEGRGGSPFDEIIKIKKDVYQEVPRKVLTKIDLPKFRSTEKEAEYFRTEYLKLRGKSVSMFEDLRRKKSVEIDELNNKLNRTVGFPDNTLAWHKAGFVILRFEKFEFFTVLQKRDIELNSFVCDKFSVNLPEKLVYKGSVYLGCNFNGKHDFVGFAIYTPKLTPFVSFHTGAGEGSFSRVCVGDLKEKPKLKMEDVNKALDGFQKMLTTINPYSFLNTHFSNTVSYQKKMREIYNYIDKYRREYNEKHTVCPDCELSLAECECERCENCHRDFDSCECAVCEGCSDHVDNVCSNGYCDDCCDETHCSNCGDSVDDLCDKCDYGIDCGCCGCKKEQ